MADSEKAVDGVDDERLYVGVAETAVSGVASVTDAQITFQLIYFQLAEYLQQRQQWLNWKRR